MGEVSTALGASRRRAALEVEEVGLARRAAAVAATGPPALECVAHLNLTSEAYLPVIDDGLARAERLPDGARVRYRLDPVGWMLLASMAPWLRLRVRTSAPFVPTSDIGREAVLDAFEHLQDEQLRRVERADGLALDRVRVTSSFNERVTYNLFACLSFLSRHQDRHLRQAEQALGVVTGD